MEAEDKLEIERLGGLAGMGLPGSRIRSRALVGAGEMNAAEKKSVAALFERGAGTPETKPDAFRYRLTLHGRHGARQVEVAENDVMPSLRDRVKDELV